MAMAPAPASFAAPSRTLPAAPAGPNPRLAALLPFGAGVVLLYFGYVRPLQLASEGVEHIFYVPKLAAMGVFFVLVSVPFILFGHAFSRVLGARPEDTAATFKRGPAFWIFMVIVAAAGVGTMIMLDQNLETMGYQRDR